MFHFDEKAPLSEKKKHIRSLLRQKRNLLSEGDWKEKSREICEYLWLSPEFSRAKTILFFASHNNEPNLFPLVERCFASKTVCFPRVSGHSLHVKAITSLDQLAPGAFSLLEPKVPEDMNPKTIDLALIPALGIDETGNRIGYGGGFYDRFLAQNPLFTLGVIFDFQRVPLLPTEKNDIPVRGMATEKGVSLFS